MTFEDWWAKEFPNVNIQWYENSSDALTKEWFNIVKQAFEDGKSSANPEDEREAYVEWLAGTFPAVFSEADAIHHWQHDHVSALAWQARAALAPAAVGDIDAMVSRFLCWRLPDNFSPDCGISFKQLGYPNSWPIGTNLLSGEQAKAMFEYVLDGARLNRNAIPVELLKKLAHCTETDCCIAYERGELRALLGKESE